jgi:hypothetical protein
MSVSSAASSSSSSWSNSGGSLPDRGSSSVPAVSESVPTAAEVVCSEGGATAAALSAHAAQSSAVGMARSRSASMGPPQFAQMLAARFDSRERGIDIGELLLLLIFERSERDPVPLLLSFFAALGLAALGDRMEVLIDVSHLADESAALALY